MQGGGVPRGDRLGVSEHDRHDRNTGRHRQPERSLLERPDRSGVKPGALGCDHHRKTLLGKLFGFLQGCHRSLGIFTVDEDRVDELAQGADHRIVGELLLAHPGPVVLHQRPDDDGVEVVAVVEDEDRWTFLLQIPLAEDVEGHPVDGQQQLREGGGEEVDAAPAVAGQQAPADGAVGGRNDRTGAEQVADLTDQPAAAAAVEFQNRPATLAGHLAHLVARIGGTRIAHEVHQRDVLVAVGVEVTARQVDLVLGGELLHRVGLARPPEDRPDHLPGQGAVAVHLEPVGERVGDAEEPGHRLNLDGQRRGTEHDGVPAVEVSLDQFPHLRIDALLDLLGEQPLADLQQIAIGTAAQRRRGLLDEVLEFHPAQLVGEPGGDHRNQFTHTHVAAAEPLLGQDHRGETRDQRAVEIEEGSDPGPRRAGHDLGHRTGHPQVP